MRSLASARIGVLSSTMTTGGVDAPNGTAELILDDNFLESGEMFASARELRQLGRRVKHLVSLRQHSSHAENFDAIGHWLQESWAKPDPASRAAALVMPAPMALLTDDALAKMTAFWAAFQ